MCYVLLSLFYCRYFIVYCQRLRFVTRFNKPMIDWLIDCLLYPRQRGHDLLEWTLSQLTSDIIIIINYYLVKVYYYLLIIIFHNYLLYSTVPNDKFKICMTISAISYEQAQKNQWGILSRPGELALIVLNRRSLHRVEGEYCCCSYGGWVA